jgi:hypothetical protein
MEVCNGQRTCAPHPNVFRVEATGKEDKENATCAHEKCSGVRWSEKQCDCNGSR